MPLRNPFRRAKTPDPATEKGEPGITLALLSDRLKAAEHDAVQLRLEWAEVLDKINAWAARQATRDRRAIQASLSEQATADREATPEPLSPTEQKNALRRNLLAGGKR